MTTKYEIIAFLHKLSSLHSKKLNDDKINNLEEKWKSFSKKK